MTIRIPAERAEVQKVVLDELNLAIVGRLYSGQGIVLHIVPPGGR